MCPSAVTTTGRGGAIARRPRQITGPRVVDTLELLAAVLHPEACRDAFPGRGVVRVY